MSFRLKLTIMLAMASVVLATSVGSAAEQPGVTDKEIKIGNTMPYSGLPPPTASLAKPNPPISICSTNKGG